MARLRWGEDTPVDPSDARRRLLDAAEACFAHFGVMKTTVEDVAAEARVSRATVYRYFEGRDELILGVLMREAERFLGRLGKRLQRGVDFPAAIADGVLFTLGAVRADPNLALLFAPEAAGVTGSIAGASEALFAASADFLRPLLTSARETGQLREGVDPEEAAEWILRTILSLLTVRGPVERTEAATRRYLLTFLVPALATHAPPAGPSTRRRRATNSK